MRKLAFVIVALGAAFLFAGNASSSVSLDLIWVDSGTPTLTVSTGVGTNVGGGCNRKPAGTITTATASSSS